MMNTPCAMHYFDHETTIERKLNTIDILANEEPYDLFEFKDSKDCPEIQVADLFVGTLGKLFRWIDEMDDEQFQETITKMELKQLESLFKINELIKRTESTCRYLICKMTAPSIMERRFIALKYASSHYLWMMKTDKE